VKGHLVIHPDGNIWTVDVVDSSGSHSLGMPQFVRERFSVVMARMGHELRGTPGIGLADVTPDRKSIMASRSSGRPVTP